MDAPGEEVVDVFEGTTVWRKEWSGPGGCVLLLHGSGPGVSALLNWSQVIPWLGQRGHTVVAADLVGFGHSGPKAEPPFFDFPLWYRQVRFLVDDLAGRVGSLCVLAHSFSAPLALRVAAEDSRIAKVVVSAPCGRPFKLTPSLRLSWSTPATPAELRTILECGVFDGSLVTEEGVDARWRLLSQHGRLVYHEALFEGDRQSFIDAMVLEDDLLRSVHQPVLIVHGKNDDIVPYRDVALSLFSLIPNADLHLLARCGHAPAAEHPDSFNRLLEGFLSQ